MVKMCDIIQITTEILIKIRSALSKCILKIVCIRFVFLQGLKIYIENIK